MLRGAVADGRAPIILASPSVAHRLEEIACSSAKCIQPKGMTRQPGGLVEQLSIVPHGIWKKCMDKKRLDMWTCVPFRCFCCEQWYVLISTNWLARATRASKQVV